jgi:cellulose synthase/poly-beta-1,6-N-acetylglucosamine synthase-like glycosyltransferase
MTSAQDVRISVIVPVRNRKDLLRRLFDALDAQTRRDFEVIVIDDGSTDGADQVAAQRVLAGRPVRLLRSGGTGAVAARTLGVAEAVGDILAFTDSDCAPRPQWLERGAAAIEGGADLVNGLTLPERPMAPLERSVSSATEGLYPTANMFFRRTAFDAVRGFDIHASRRLGFRHSRLARGTGFGEDVILAWRMIRAGFRAVHVPEAEVRHHVFPADMSESLDRGWQTAAFPQLVVEVPELRRTIMHHGVLFGDRSRVPFYATAAALLLRQRSVAGVAVTWWTLLRLREMRRLPFPWQRKLPFLPAEMLVDAVMGTAMIVGSARARTIVL